MKTINWGTKIVMGMATFMLFIIGMVIYMFSVQNRDALIEDNYYEKGINFDADYRAAENVIQDQAWPEIKINAQDLNIHLRDSAQYTLVLMRPSNKAEDRTFTGTTLGGSDAIVINRVGLSSGMWFLNLRWTHHQKEYLFKKNITF